MNSTVIQHWQYSYLCVGLLVAVSVVVAADHLRAGDPPAPLVRFAALSLAGALWPVMVVGLIQWWALTTLSNRGRPTPVPHRPAPRDLMGVGLH